MPSVFFLIFGGFLVLVVTLGLLAAAAARKRREALAAWAARHQLRFAPEKQRGLDERFPNFACLRQGSNRYAENLLQGPWEGRDLLAFDYHYETHSTDSKGRRTTHHHHFGAVILTSPVPLKPLAIRAENFLDKLAGFLGWDDIDFESAEFSRRFHVSSPDRRWAFDVLHARTIEFLLQSPRYSINFDAGHVIAWSGGRMSVEQLQAAIEVIDGILDRLPEYVVRQQMELTHGS